MRERSWWILLATALWFCVPATQGLAVEPRVPTEAELFQGVGESRWGEIPPTTDSTRAVLEKRAPALWTYPLMAPYYVVAAPLGLAFDGVGAVVENLDRSGIFYKLFTLLGPHPGPFGMTLNAQAGGLDGFGGGLTAYHDAFFGPENLFKARLFGTTKASVKTHFGVILPQGRDSQIELGAGYRSRSTARYFGIGPRIDPDGPDGESLESHYTQETTWGGVSYLRGIGSKIQLEPRIMFTASGARAPHEDEEEDALDLIHPDDVSLPGFGYRDRSDGVSFGLSLIHNTAVEEGRPESGGLRKLHVDYFTAVDGSDLTFWTFRGEVQEFIPLWFTQRALAVRGMVGWLEEQDGELPFTRLFTNDESDLMRGYEDFRWRDRGLALLTLEYRWPVWGSGREGGAGLDAFLFSDLAQVFGEFDQIALNYLAPSYGGGIRFIGNNGFLGRIELATSDEETVFRLKADQVFQYDKDGFYNGRNPIPLR